MSITQELRHEFAGCTVLLKKDGAFPLEKPCRLAAYGHGVRHTVRGGTGSGEVNTREAVTVEQGLLDAGFTLTTGAWLDAMDTRLSRAQADFRKTVKRRARRHHTLAAIECMGAICPEPEYDIPIDADGDAAIYVLSRKCGEGTDRTLEKGDYCLTDSEVRDILALNTRFERFMLVLNVGAPVDLTPVRDVGNILLLSQLGEQTGNVLADILLGRSYPSGHLTASWVSAQGLCQPGSFGEADDTDYKEGVFVGSRYYDTAGAEVLYPFGFGLGYADFALSGADCALTGDRAGVTVTVENTGSHAGREVVQLYVSVPDNIMPQPEKIPAGWLKTDELLSGERQSVSVSFSLRELACFDEKRSAYILPAGDYIVHTGRNSRDTEPTAVLRLEREVVLKRVRGSLGTPAFADWEPPKKRSVMMPENIPVLSVDADCIAEETVRYDEEPDIPASVQALTDEELARLNVGAYSEKSGLAEKFGYTDGPVPGAAGFAPKPYEKLGLRPPVMADGPAGVRLPKSYFVDESGVHTQESSFPATVMEYMPAIARPLIALARPRPGRGAQIIERSCTALPIGTALAQSGDLALAEACGDIVGEEMRKNGVTLWLAPALNIQRSPLCGRNFEYYSEDPLVSGLFAAALVRGVQRHPGCGVTIKHFAANNQETNREHNSSNVSERALREIYLRAFEICLQNSSPAAVMTSYNLINGVHTSESRALSTDILRAEFGFAGFVMTDWVIAGSGPAGKYPSPDPAKVAAAGCSLFMPGSRQDYEAILRGLKDGTVTRHQLMVNVTRVLQAGTYE